jgi:YVTN family beta-propeller protein
VILLAMLALPVGLACQTLPVRTVPIAPGQSRLSVYLQALPGDARRLSFQIRSVSLVGEDGRVLPLTLHIDEVSDKTLDRERLLASASLPPGSYAGLELEIEAASVGRGADRTSLSIGPGAVRVDLPIHAGKRRGSTISLRFHPSDSLDEGLSFAPVFSGQIPVHPPGGVVALATSHATDSVILFDKISGRVVGIVPTGREPSGMVLARLQRRAYVAIAGDDSVEVIDIDEQSTIEKLRLQGGDAPRELALTPDGRTLLSANHGSNTVSFIDPDRLSEIDRVSVGNGPNSILVGPAGRRAYVFNSLGDSISVLDLPGRAVVGAIRTEAEPLRGQFSLEGDRIYVIHRGSPNMLVVDPATLTVQDRIHVRAGAQALKVDDRTGWIYVGSKFGGIEVFEPDSFLPVGTIPTRGSVNYLTIDGDAGNLFCVLSRPAAVRSISIASQRTVTSIDAGKDPYQVTMMGER